MIAHKPFYKGAFSSELAGMLAGKRGTNQLLSPRENTIVKLVAEGCSNKGISATLNISIKTVETHRAAVMRKLSEIRQAGSVCGLHQTRRGRTAAVFDKSPVLPRGNRAATRRQRYPPLARVVFVIRAPCRFRQMILGEQGLRDQIDIRHGNPGIDIMLGRIDMAIAHRCAGRDGHVERKLQHRHDRIPA